MRNDDDAGDQSNRLSLSRQIREHRELFEILTGTGAGKRAGWTVGISGGNVFGNHDMVAGM